MGWLFAFQAKTDPIEGESNPEVMLARERELHGLELSVEF